MMKKASIWLTALLAATALLSGCGSSETDSSTPAPPPVTEITAVKTEPNESGSDETGEPVQKSEHPYKLTEISTEIPADARTKVTQILTNAKGEKGQPHTLYLNEHDDVLLEYDVRTSGEKGSISCYEYEYNAEGKKTWEHELLDFGTERETYFSYQGANEVWAHYEDRLPTFTIAFHYDQYGNLLGDDTDFYQKQAAQKGIQKLQLHTTEILTDLAYDADGHILSACRYKKNGDLDYKMTYTYDKAGNRLTSNKVFTKFGEKEYDIYREYHEYQYDKNGNTIRDEQTQWKTPDEITSHTIYAREYDAENRLLRVEHTYPKGDVEITTYTYEPL